MPKLPKISLITPSFNQGQFIRETINSVLSQNYPNLEYMVMDGGSTDETVSILKSYGKKFRWISRKDEGQTDAINQGMKLAKGEVVGYLNSDDVLEPGALQLVGERFASKSGLQWLTGDYFIIDSTGKPIQSFVRWYKQLFRIFGSQNILLVLNYIVQPSTFWRRSAFKKVGYFDASLRYCMDYDFWLRLIKRWQPEVVNQPLSRFRIHQLSKGGAEYVGQFAEEVRVAKKYSNNGLLATLHSLHATATVQAYRWLK